MYFKKIQKKKDKNKHHQASSMIWILQSANPKKQVIPENQLFGSFYFKAFLHLVGYHGDSYVFMIAKYGILAFK